MMTVRCGRPHCRTTRRTLVLASFFAHSFSGQVPALAAGESESGERPERAQRCKADALFLMPLKQFGKAKGADEA